MRTLDDAQVCGKNVLAIVDYNVHVADGSLMSTFKIDQTMETIRNVVSRGPKALVICTHLGRPRTREENSTMPIFDYLSGLLEGLKYVEIRDIISGIKCKGPMLTDNSRYYDDRQLAMFYRQFDIIVNDAFGCAHRPVPYKSYAGMLMKREIEALDSLRHCDLLIMGGAKALDKLKLLERFDCKVFLSGCLGTSVLRHMGVEVGNRSLFADYDSSSVSNKISCGGIALPVDFKVLGHDGECKVKARDSIGETDAIIDIGPESVKMLMSLIGKSSIIFWNGPVGKLEDPQADATQKLVQGLAECGARVLAGGGETSSAISKYSSVDRFYHVSTGGGALLCFLCGERMPGIESICE